MGTSDSNFTPTELHDAQQERDLSQRLAERYRCPFVDLNDVRIDPELFRVIPADLMFRFNFVPLQAHDHQLVIAVADPSQVLLSD
jgi:type IV pilus assembly protein PilB